ncbi:MAG: hypothetical protein HYR74_02465, partial [Candidatus Eisenbacteria bacterium]|nr:hypothetical protein [Candidatus Eisenbacteria bacterium]
RALAAVRTVDAIVLVGHEPHLGRLASTLLFGTPGHPLTLKKAGVCTLAFDDRIAPGEARLCGFLAPRVLRRLGGRASRIAVVAGHVAAHERAS